MKLFFFLLNVWLWASYANTCPKFKLRESCYLQSFCYWNSISKECSVLPNINCVQLPISEDCYEFEDCFWHNSLSSCQNVSEWTFSTGEVTLEVPTSQAPITCPPQEQEDPCWRIQGCFFNRRSMQCEKLPTNSAQTVNSAQEFCKAQLSPTACLNQNNMCYFQSGHCKAIKQMPMVGSSASRPATITCCEDLSYEYCEGTQIGPVTCLWDGNECDEAEQLESAVLGHADPKDEGNDDKSRPEEWFWIPSIFAVSFIACFALLVFSSRKTTPRLESVGMDQYDELHDPEKFEWKGNSKITVED